MVLACSVLLVKPELGCHKRQQEDSGYQKLLFKKNGCARSPLLNICCRTTLRYQLDRNCGFFEFHKES